MRNLIQIVETGARGGATRKVPPTRLFHGSIHKVSEFRPLTHFGTLRAAVERLSARNGASGYIYPVSLSITNALVVPDGDAILRHKPSTYVMRFEKQGIVSGEQANTVIRTSVLDSDMAASAAPCAMLRELAYDGLCYRNRYEDVGSTSWCTFSSDQVTIAGTSMFLTMDEIAAPLDNGDFDEAAIRSTPNSATPSQQNQP